MNGIRIENAVQSQAPLLSKMGAETFYTYFGEYNHPDDMEDYVGRAFSLEQTEKEFKETGSVFLLAYVDSEVAGYARLRVSTEEIKELNGTKSIELQRIYVLPDFLKKKVGAALMHQVLDLTKNNGFEVLWLGVWEKNERALAFYERWGFEKFSSHIFMLGKDAQTDILMLKRI